MTFGRGTTAHNKEHNLYAFHMAQATYEGLTDAYPEERPFVLSRAGSPGISQFAANWMGDNMSRWDHLWLSIPMGCGLGLSGQPFNGADIGGFAGDCEPELLLRWYQLGMLSAFARNHTHAGSVEQFPWSFDGQFLAEIRQAINLRYQLLPYLYSCFLLAHDIGRPIQTPLVYYYPNDLTCRTLDTQFMLGEQILVAPILTPGQLTADIYIPSNGWVDFYTRQPLEPGWHTYQVRQDRIPLFARGNFVLLNTAPTSTTSAKETPLAWVEFSDFTSVWAFDDFTPQAQTHTLTLSDFETTRREITSQPAWMWSRDIAPAQEPEPVHGLFSV
jgi:alpha-glucosidase